MNSSLSGLLFIKANDFVVGASLFLTLILDWKKRNVMLTKANILNTVYIVPSGAGKINKINDKMTIVTIVTCFRLAPTDSSQCIKLTETRCIIEECLRP